MSRRSFGIALFSLIVLAFVLGVGGFAPGASFAATPQIAPSSCGGLGADGTNCSFAGDGTDVVIGPNSCNEANACRALENGVKINANGSTGSCNGQNACSDLGQDAMVGSNSCNGEGACHFGGSNGGEFDVGDGSCDAQAACLGGGQDAGRFQRRQRFLQRVRSLRRRRCRRLLLHRRPHLPYQYGLSVRWQERRKLHCGGRQLRWPGLHRGRPPKAGASARASTPVWGSWSA